MPSGEKYEDNSFCCKVELMFNMLIPAASEEKMNLGLKQDLLVDGDWGEGEGSFNNVKLVFHWYLRYATLFNE